MTTDEVPKQKFVGYARVSTVDQNLDLQLDALEKAGCTVFFSDIASGAKDNRPGLAQAMDALTEGDTLIVWKLDRLGRSLKHLVHTVESLTHRKIGIRSLSDAGMTTETATGRLMFNMLASLAQFERELIKERTQAGLKSALARGRKGGRKPHLTNEKFQEASRLINVNGLTVRQAAACVRVSKSTLYAALARTRNQQSMRSEDSKPSGA